MKNHLILLVSTVVKKMAGHDERFQELFYELTARLIAIINCKSEVKPSITISFIGDDLFYVTEGINLISDDVNRYEKDKNLNYLKDMLLSCSDEHLVELISQYLCVFLVDIWGAINKKGNIKLNTNAPEEVFDKNLIGSLKSFEKYIEIHVIANK